MMVRDQHADDRLLHTCPHPEIENRPGDRAASVSLSAGSGRRLYCFFENFFGIGETCFMGSLESSMPLAVAQFRSAPRFSSSLTASVQPIEAAIIKGVAPLSRSAASILAPCSSKQIGQPELPPSAAS